MRAKETSGLSLWRQWPERWQGWWELRQRTPRRLLGLSLTAGQLEAAVVERVNGQLNITQTTQVPMALDPLTAEPELVGREIRQHLDAAGIRVRVCVLDLPLEHVLSLSVSLPDLPAEDQESLLTVEAERTFPHNLEELRLAMARFGAPGGPGQGMVLALARDRAERFEATLRAAQLRMWSLAPGLCALDPPESSTEAGVVALWPVSNCIQLQIVAGGLLFVLRALEGMFDWEGPNRVLLVDELLRELRLSLGQLPPPWEERIRILRVWGRSEAATELAEKLIQPAARLGLRVEQVRSLPETMWGLAMPHGSSPSAAVALAARALAGRPALFEFLPTRPSVWQQLRKRYASRRFTTVSLALGGVAGLLGAAFLAHQSQLWYWERQWRRMESSVRELERIQARIRQYRPWFDESFRSLMVLRRLTEAFPEDGTVSAKTVEIRDNGRVVCTGTARDQAALLKALDRLRAMSEVRNVQVEQMRGNAPMQFGFHLQWGESGGS
ncbi:MAG: hypothetical protein RMN51_03635 [Verrucomicrobiota bacterium]|nr:hypothetical protein [Limisphaera sp.]MDW8381191.1 hypothetical protein [Verrucomicrobiota bacterium]